MHAATTDTIECVAEVVPRDTEVHGRSCASGAAPGRRRSEGRPRTGPGSREGTGRASGGSRGEVCTESRPTPGRGRTAWRRRRHGQREGEEEEAAPGRDRGGGSAGREVEEEEEEEAGAGDAPNLREETARQIAPPAERRIGHGDD